MVADPVVVTTGEAITAKLSGRTPVRTLPGRNGTKADVHVYELEDGKVAVKDYRARSFFARHSLGRFLVRRECRAYEAAGDVPGLAPFLGRCGPFALATRWIDARPLAARDGERLPDEVFDRLDTILAALHAKGVALADLHHRDVLLGDDGSVHVVDLAAARMRARFTGRSEAEALASLDPASVRMWKRGRLLKRLWDVLRGKGA